MTTKILNTVGIYASTHAVNSAAAQMSEHIEKLRDTGLIKSEQAQHRIASVEEIRALTSADVNLNMVDPELRSARTAEQKRLGIERKWKRAEGNRRQSMKRGRKPR